MQVLAAGVWKQAARGAESATGGYSVRVTAGKPGRYTYRVVAAPWQAAASVTSTTRAVTVPLKLATPTISGAAEVDAGLTAKTNKEVETYQWLRDGTALSDAHRWNGTYQVELTDAGHKIQVKVCDSTECKTSAAIVIRSLTEPLEFNIDNNSKASVEEAFDLWKKAAQNLLAADETPVVGANLATCVTGNLSDTQRKYSTSLLNFYREFAGVPKVFYDTALETGTMNAAVLNSVNGQFSHSFSKETNPKCWDQLSGNTGHNILYGASGLSWNIPGWIDDSANVQDNVGHRTNLMEPFWQTVAFGLTAGGGIASGNTDLDLAAYRGTQTPWTWPTAGYFPVSELPTRWSYSEVLPERSVTDPNLPDDPRNHDSDYTNDVHVNETTTDVLTVAYDGGTPSKPEVGGGDWFRMNTDLKAGDYAVTITRTYTAQIYQWVTGSDGSYYEKATADKPIETTKTYAYAVNVF